MNDGGRTPQLGARFALALLFAAGCAQVLGIEEIVPLPACGSAADCDDANACTIDVCGPSGTCIHEPEPDGPATDQLVGDCQRIECTAGVAQSIPDDSDVPVDDNSCTEDVCDSGAPSNPTLPEGSPCDDGNGHLGACSASGACDVVCTAETELEVCDDDNGCTVDDCDVDRGICVHAALSGVVAPDPQQTAGDCQLIMCWDGIEQPTIDDEDLPDDSNECTEDGCSSGVASYDPVELGTSCTQGGGTFCNGDPTDPACVQCNVPSDCTALPEDDECRTRTCVDGACGQSFVPSSTPIAAQTAGDCQVVVCDGNGGMLSIADDDDLPDDDNDCTVDLCNAGVPSHSNSDANSPCGEGGSLYCDGNGVCQGCNQASQCGTNTFCMSWTCSNGSCGQSFTAADTPLPAQSQISGDCQQLQCNGTGGIKTVAYNSDVPADDGNQCTSETCSNGAPQHPARPLDYPCNQDGGSYCDGASSCVACNNAGQCPDPGITCKIAACLAHACGAGNAAPGTPLPSGQQVVGDCKLLVCDGSGGTTTQTQNSDVPVDNNPCTSDVCANGVPSNPPTSPFTPCDTGDGYVCDGAGQCVGSCWLEPNPPGTSCPAVCTGGCGGGECRIDCLGPYECEHDLLFCPPGFACTLTCSDHLACRYAELVCPPFYACRAVCLGDRSCENMMIDGADGTVTIECFDGLDACRNTEVFCGPNACTAICDPSEQPKLYCGPSCSCNEC